MTTEVVSLTTDGTLMFWCPGCKEHHGVPVDGSRGWEWDGDRVKPTIKPSILVRGTLYGPGRETFRNYKGPFPPVQFADGVCHSFVKGGLIEFLKDCTHDLAGQTVPLEPINPSTTPKETE